MRNFAVDEKLKEFATLRQREAIDTFLQLGSIQRSAEQMGITPSRFRGLLSEARSRAARRGWSPEADAEGTAAEGFKVKGKSTYYRVNPDGSLQARGQWVKTQIEEDHKLKLIMDACQTFAEPFRDVSTVVRPKKPGSYLDDYLTVIPWGDPHFGMYAWAAETGADFNLDIAEETLCNAVDELVAMSPPSREALIINLGDFFHSDSLENVTRRSKNPLDVDTRWPKVLGIGLRAFKRCIHRCLEKHHTVRVINEIGNHDDHTAMFLAITLESHFHNNPRVIIDTSPRTEHYHVHGDCLIGVTHGHNIKANDLLGVMANASGGEMWGKAKHRFWYTGHVHHDTLKEYPGVTVETFRTLASKDAWHASKGYMAMRDMKCDILHKKSGRKIRYTVTIDEVL